MNARPAPARRPQPRRATPPSGPRAGLRLVAVAVALALLLFVSGASLALRNERNDRDRATEQQATVARAAATSVDQFLSNRFSLLQVMAAAPAVRAVDTDGMRRYFADVITAEPDLARGFFWVDLTGIARVSALTIPPGPPIDLSDRDYVQAVLATDRPFVSEGVIARNDNQPQVVVAVPTHDARGALTGLLATGVTLDGLARTLDEFHIGAGGETLVVDRAGRLIVAGGSAAAITDVSASPLIARARSDGAGLTTDATGVRGQEHRLVAFAPVPAGDWLVFVDRSRADAFGPARRTLLFTLAALLGVAVVAIGGAVWAARRLDLLAHAQRRAQREREETFALLDTILQTAPVGLAFLDRDLRFVRVNRALAEMHRRPPEEHLGHTLAEVLPDAPETLAAAQRRVLEQAEPLTGIEVAMNKGDPAGDRSYVVSYYPVGAQEGRIAGVGTVVADMTERHRAEQRQRFLADASAQLAASLDYASTLQSLARLAAAHLADYCLIYLGTATGEVTQVAAAHADPAKDALVQQAAAIYLPDPADRNSVTSRALRTGRSALVPEITPAMMRLIAKDAEQERVFAGLGPRSGIAVPLVARGQVLGAIVLAMAESGRRYGPDDLALVEELAHRAAIAIDNARLFDAERAQRARAEAAQRRLAFLAEASALLAASLGYEATLTELARLVTPDLADWSVVDVVAADGTIRRLAAHHPDPAKQATLHDLQARYPPRTDSAEGVARVLRTGQPALYPELTDDMIETLAQDHDHAARLRGLGMASRMIVPLIARGRILGAVSFARAAAGRPYTDDDLALAEELARRAAVAVDNAMLYRDAQVAEEQTRAHAARLRALAEASRAFAEVSLELRAVLETVAERAAGLIGDTCIIRLLSDDGRWLDPGAVYDPDPAALAYTEDVLGRVRHRADIGLNGRVVQTGEPLLLPVVDQEELRAATHPEYGEHVERYVTHSLVIVPMRVQGEVIGAISLSRKTPDRPYTPSDQLFLRDLADRAALAVVNARLYEAERAAHAEAEVANRAKDEFLSTLSHELRTPLTAMLGWAHMLRTRKMDEEATARAVETIERSAKAQAALIEDILDLSRVVTGKLRLEVRPLDPATVVEAAVDAVRPAADAKGIALTVRLDPAGPVSGDPARLQQVAWNLLTNAIKFTPEGGRVDVRLERAGRTARIGVRDTGEGIDPAFLPHVFERFRQADSSSTRTHSGLGLGLAIVRHLVEMHGGTVQAHSDGPGQGATFTVTLPLALAGTLPAGAGPHQAAHLFRPVGVRGPHSALLEGLQVLVVDDEADTREMLTAVLGGSGAAVVVAASAAEALAVLEHNQPDVLVGDIAMPETDGYDLIAQVRAREDGSEAHLPALALTAFAGEEDRQRALAAGYELHMAKPAEPEHLIAAVARLAGRAGAVAPARSESDARP